MQSLLHHNSKGEQGNSNPLHTVAPPNSSFPWLPCVKSLAQLSIDSSRSPFPAISHISWLKTLEKSGTKSRTRTRTKKLPISASSAPPRETVTHQLRSSFPGVTLCKSSGRFSSTQFPIAVRVFRKISAPRRLCARILLV
jgi:hypothetical protein